MDVMKTMKAQGLDMDFLFSELKALCEHSNKSVRLASIKLAANLMMFSVKESATFVRAGMVDIRAEEIEDKEASLLITKAKNRLESKGKEKFIESLKQAGIDPDNIRDMVQKQERLQKSSTEDPQAGTYPSVQRNGTHQGGNGVLPPPALLPATVREEQSDIS